MKFTHKSTYGVMAALDLALHNGLAPVRAKAIAKRQAIPARFLEQVLAAMKKAGLVDSQRGAQGGYILRKKPSEVSVADIVEALEGPISPSSHKTGPRSLPGRQTTRESVLAAVREQLRQAEFNVLQGVTLKELVDRHRQLEDEQVLMYHI